MLPDRVSNPGPPTYESGALPIAVCVCVCFLVFVSLFYNLQHYCLFGGVLCPTEQIHMHVQTPIRMNW